MANGAKRRSVLEETTVDRKTITAKIDPELYAELERLEKRLEAFGGKLTFNRARIIEGALREAVEAGHAELDEREKKAA